MAEDIAQWLDGFGLGQYAQAFDENGVAITIPVLYRRENLHLRVYTDCKNIVSARSCS